MAMTFRHRRTGKVVEVAEESEVSGRHAKLNARRTLTKVQQATRKWVRLTDPEEIAAARQAWEANLRRTTATRTPAPTPVYVVNQAAASPAPEPPRSQPEPAPEPEPEPATADEPSSPPERPRPYDSKADWVAYAEAQGVTDADVLTKTELVERFTA